MEQASVLFVRSHPAEVDRADASPQPIGVKIVAANVVHRMKLEAVSKPSGRPISLRIPQLFRDANRVLKPVLIFWNTGTPKTMPGRLHSGHFMISPCFGLVDDPAGYNHAHFVEDNCLDSLIQRQSRLHLIPQQVGLRLRWMGR